MVVFRSSVTHYLGRDSSNSYSILYIIHHNSISTYYHIVPNMNGADNSGTCSNENIIANNRRTYNVFSSINSYGYIT